MRTPPVFSDFSAARLESVLAAAIKAADADPATHPNAALAKAAADNRLPVAHVPLAVRAYNNGRAARQLAAGADAWGKAASFPTADADGVVAALAGPAAKAADLSDYDTPPKRRSSPGVPDATAEEPAEEPEEAVVTAASDAKAAAAAPPPAPDLVANTFAASDLVAELNLAARGLPPGGYAAVKAAAADKYPDAAAFAFARIERADYHLGKRAAEAFDPAFPAGRHPIVALIGRLAGLKAASAVPAPPPAAAAEAAGELHPILGRLPAVKAAAQPAAPASVPFATPVGVTVRRLQSLRLAKAASFGTAFGGTVFGLPRKVRQGMTAGLGLTEDGDRGFMDAAARIGAQAHDTKADRLSAQVGKTRGDLEQMRHQADLQTLLTDQRFAHADKPTVLKVYQQLAALAPTAMRNPAVAGDFIDRRLQTGPLGFHELDALTRIEANLAKARQAAAYRDED